MFGGERVLVMEGLLFKLGNVGRLGTVRMDTRLLGGCGGGDVGDETSEIPKPPVGWRVKPSTISSSSSKTVDGRLRSTTDESLCRRAWPERDKVGLVGGGGEAGDVGSRFSGSKLGETPIAGNAGAEALFAYGDSEEAFC